MTILAPRGNSSLSFSAVAPRATNRCLSTGFVLRLNSLLAPPCPHDLGARVPFLETMIRFPRSLLLLLVAACGSDSLAPPIQRGMKFVRGAGISDTATAIPTSALVVEVHDSTGARAPVGTAVRFTATNVLVSQLDATAFSSFVARAVDSSGRAAVLVRLGSVAGSGTVAISVPALGLADTAKYTILPGSPVRVLLAPADTLVGVGRSFRYRGGVVDQYGNRRDDPITWSADPTATLTSDGTLTVPAIGRYRITATASIAGVVRSGTAQVSAVPKARIAAWRNGSISLMDFDGANVRTLATVADGGIGASAQWMPTGDAIIYSTLVNGIQRLYVTDTLGVSRPFFATAPPNVSHQAEPRVPAGGQWLIFAAYDTRCIEYCLYRARIDGTGPEMLSSAVWGSNPVFAPSPDGSQVAVYTGAGVRMFDVATKTLSSWVSSASWSPAWSPDGTKIAVIQSGGLVLINPDGSTIRGVAKTPLWSGSLAWLADSRFLVARTTSGAWELIDTQAGSEIPLPFTGVIGAMSVR